MHFDHGRRFDHCITYMYTQRPLDDEGGGHTMHRDKVPSHMYHKMCTYQCDATTLYSLTTALLPHPLPPCSSEGGILSQQRAEEASQVTCSLMVPWAGRGAAIGWVTLS